MRQPIERLTLDAPDGTVELPLHALTDPAQAKPVDWVLLCTKTHATASTAPWLQAPCVPSTRVAVLQNGIDHVARVAPFADAATVLPVIVYYNGERLGADRVRLRRGADQDFIVADDDAGRAFTQLFEGTPLRVIARQRFRHAGVAQASDQRRRQSGHRADAAAASGAAAGGHPKLCLAVLEEAIAVGRAEGAQLAADEAARTLATLFTFSGELGTSMYFDRLAGRPLEHEALTGAIVTAGERHGIATPLNRALLALLRAISDAAAR